MLQKSFTKLLPLALAFCLGDRVRAEDIPDKTRAWNKIPACEYLANKYNDGDSFQAKVANEVRWLRLPYVDTPEADERFATRNEEQAKHFGISPSEVTTAGKEASVATAKLLSQPFTVYTRWASAAGSTRLPRFSAFIELSDGRDLGEVLLSMGLARVKGTKMNTPKGETVEVYQARLEKLEAEAKARGVGSWAHAAGKK